MTKDSKEEETNLIQGTKDEQESSKPKVSFTRVLTFLFKLCFDKTFLLIQILNLVKDSFKVYKPFVDGNIVNAITLEKNLENMIYWGKVRMSMLFLEFFILKMEKKFELIDDVESYIDKVRHTFYRKILKKEMVFHDNYSLSRIQDIYQNDFNGLYVFLPSKLISYAGLMFRTLFSFFVLLSFSYELFLIQTVSFLLDIYASYKYSDVSWDDYENCNIKRNEIFSEGLMNIRLIKCFSLENKIVKIFKGFTRSMQKIVEKHTSLRENFGSNSYMYSLTILKTFYCGKMVLDGKLGLGDFLKFRVVASELNSGGKDLFNFYRDLLKEYRKILNVFEAMDFHKPEKKGSFFTQMAKIFSSKRNNKISDLQGAQNEAHFEGHIEFRNVDFRYPARSRAQIFKNLSFKINRGDVVAFVGGSGSGKSTIASLFHRLYHPENGDVLIDNKNIKEIDMVHFHNKIGYVSQEPCLFSLTIRENILFGLNKEYTTDEEKQKLEEKLNSIIKKANCGFVYDKSIFPDGLDTLVSGNNLSGGQKQRIAIARALMKEVNFLIFDEATSALDANSESEVQKAIDEIIKEANITTIIIAHRLSTIKNCHKIFVLNKGKVVEEGTHKELKKLNGFYKELINKQIEAYDKDDQETLLRKKTSKII